MIVPAFVKVSLWIAKQAGVNEGSTDHWDKFTQGVLDIAKGVQGLVLDGSQNYHWDQISIGTYSAGIHFSDVVMPKLLTDNFKVDRPAALAAKRAWVRIQLATSEVWDPPRMHSFKKNHTNLVLIQNENAALLAWMLQ